jgi:hypothetical protein
MVEAPVEPDWYSTGCLVQRGGKSKLAILCFKRALQSQPDRAAAHHNLAMALLDTGDHTGKLFIPHIITTQTLLVCWVSLVQAASSHYCYWVMVSQVLRSPSGLACTSTRA